MKENSKNITRRSFIERTGIIAAGLTLIPAKMAAYQKAGGKAPVLTVLDRTSQPMVVADRPWEEFCIGLGSVLRTRDQWHLWYSSYDHDYVTDNDVYSCYARSKDGTNWEKPSLGIYSYKGSSNNNILMKGFSPASLVIDKEAPPAERFKAVGACQHGVGYGPWWVYGATSPDGLHWKLLEEPLLKKNSDTLNICIHDRNIYRLYVRMWSEGDFKGNRIVGYTESATFGNFPDPVEILAAGMDEAGEMQFYNSATTKLKNNLYLMFPSGFFKKDGTSMIYAAFSRDGKHFTRLGRTPLLGLGKGFDSKGMYAAAGAIPGETPGTYWIYYGGTAVPHDDNEPDKVHSDGGIGRFLLNVTD